MSQIDVSWKNRMGEGTIPVQVIYSRRRTMGLEVRPDGTVAARVPLGTADKMLMAFVGEHRQWIMEKWFLMEERRQARESRPPADYEENPSLERQYRELARRRITERVCCYAAQMGVSYGRITIRAAKTRWGSCSSAGNLGFHWKLVLMPPEVLDYVVVHELAHRKEMNHSSRFWKEVEKVLPDYRQTREWLKQHGGEV